MGATGRRLIIMGWAALGLSGCQSTAPAPETALAPAPIVQREGVSLAYATLALVSLDGAPQAASDDFRQALAKRLAAREVASVAPEKARYLLRVYLAASPAEGGAELDYVADLFDAQRVRVGRLSDGLGLKGGGDAWSLASSAALDAAASQCADEIAAFLSNRPEAQPARGAAMSFAE